MCSKWINEECWLLNAWNVKMHDVLELCNEWLPCYDLMNASDPCLGDFKGILGVSSSVGFYLNIEPVRLKGYFTWWSICENHVVYNVYVAYVWLLWNDGVSSFFVTLGWCFGVGSGMRRYPYIAQSVTWGLLGVNGENVKEMSLYVDYVFNVDNALYVSCN